MDWRTQSMADPHGMDRTDTKRGFSGVTGTDSLV